MTYAIIRSAIERRECLTAKYEDYLRFFSPHVLGEDRRGNASVLVFQYDGGRKGGLPSTGAWCIFQLGGLTGTRRNHDLWSLDTKRKPSNLFRLIDVQA